MSKLTEIEDRAKKATEGPWWRDDGEGYSINRVRSDKKTIADVIGDSAETDATAEFIAHSHEDIPYLLSLLRSAEEALRGVDEWGRTKARTKDDFVMVVACRKALSKIREKGTR